MVRPGKSEVFEEKKSDFSYVQHECHMKKPGPETGPPRSQDSENPTAL
jgi:hypothetical protein